MKKLWLFWILLLCARLGAAQVKDTLSPAVLYLRVEAFRRLPADLAKAERVAALAARTHSNAPAYLTLLDEAVRIAAAGGRADLVAVLEAAKRRAGGGTVGGAPGDAQRGLGHRSPSTGATKTVPAPGALRAAYEEAVRTTTASGDRELLLATRLTYADHLVRYGHPAESLPILRNLATEGTLSENDRIHILSQLVIHLFKLDQQGEAHSFYVQLQQERKKGLSRDEAEEWLLATALYHDYGGRPLQAKTAYWQLAGGGEPQSAMEQEAALRLAILYSRQLRRDSADVYFDRVAQHARSLPASLHYEQAAAYEEHRRRFRQPPPATDWRDALRAQDSQYRQELVRVTRELSLQNEVLESRHRVQAARQQQQMAKLEGAALQQRFVTLVLVLCLLTLLTGAGAYTIFLRRKQAAILHRKEVERLQEKHRHDVLLLLARAQESERGRLAARLHDEIGSMLSVARLNLSALTNSPDAPTAGRVKVETAAKLLDTIAVTVREMSHQLMPVALQQYGLKQSIRQLVADINAAGRVWVEEVIVGFDNGNALPQEFAVGIYRIVQELLQNVVKHAAADRALLQLVEHDDMVSILVEDNGTGMPAGDARHGRGLGLLRTRVEYLRGQMVLETGSEGGLLVAVELPRTTFVL